jgi:hypothetical protein
MDSSSLYCVAGSIDYQVALLNSPNENEFFLLFLFISVITVTRKYFSYLDWWVANG